jgi:putative effector of murein hydrolase
MQDAKKKNPVILIAVIFLLCFVIRLIEVLGLRLDETFINENFIHKLLGLAILAAALRLFSLSRREIGFDFSRFLLPTLLGLGLGLGRFAVGYGAECLILPHRGNAHPSSSMQAASRLRGSSCACPPTLFC